MYLHGTPQQFNGNTFNVCSIVLHSVHSVEVSQCKKRRTHTHKMNINVMRLPIFTHECDIHSDTFLHLLARHVQRTLYMSSAFINEIKLHGSQSHAML